MTSVALGGRRTGALMRVFDGHPYAYGWVSADFPNVNNPKRRTQSLTSMVERRRMGRDSEKVKRQDGPGWAEVWKCFICLGS